MILTNCKVETETVYGEHGEPNKAQLKISVPVPGGNFIYTVPIDPDMRTSIDQACSLANAKSK